MDFKIITGHKKAAGMLKNAFKKQNLPHSYIFQGPSGIGKKLTAQVFAKALNCLDEGSPEPCGVCDNCAAIRNPYVFHPDIRIYRNVNEPLWIDRSEMTDTVCRNDSKSGYFPEEYSASIRLMEEYGIILPADFYSASETSVDCIRLNQDLLFTKDKTDNSFCIDIQTSDKLSEKLKKESPLASKILSQLIVMNVYAYKARLPIGKRGVRGIIQDIYLKPSSGRKKVFIIDNAHNITEEAADALLKTLEEPPANSVLILITSAPSGLLQTIRSRCETVRFSFLAKEDFLNVMRKKLPGRDEEIEGIYPFSGGSPGSALEMFSFEPEKIKELIIEMLGRDTDRDNALLSLLAEEGFFSQQEGVDSEKTKFFLTCFRRIVRDLVFYDKGAREGVCLNDDMIKKFMPLTEMSAKKLEKMFFLSCELSGKLDYNFNSQLMIEEFLYSISAL